jgi:type II secretory pathway component GspD/PulD (secretin)
MVLVCERRQFKLLPRGLAQVLLSLFSLYLLFSSVLPSQVSAAPMVTMSVVDADVRDVLTGLATIGKVNVVIDDSVTGKISVNLKNIPFEAALDTITRSKGLSMHRTGNVIVFASLEKMEKGFGLVRVFPLKYARADHIKNIIVGGGKSDSEFMVENPGASSSSSSGTLAGKVSASTTSSANKEGIKGLVLNTDASTNSLIAFGAPEQIEKVQLLLKELDVPYQQILLEAQVMALSKNASKSLGIDWSWSQFPSAASSSSSTTTTSYFPIGIVTGGDGQVYKFGVNATLNALIANGDGKLLARPNVITFNGNKATIFVGDELPVVTPSTTGSGGTVTYTTEYKKAGITLSFVPRTNEEDNISASVFVEVSTPMTVTLDVGGQKTTAYQITTRSAQTNVRMKDGDTMVIGGLISSTDTKNFNKVPFLGDLPILGKLFQSVSKSKIETEVVIFLKAKIVK